MGKTKELIISIVIAVLLSKFVEYIWRNVSYSQNNVFLLGKVYTVVNDVRVKNKKIQRKSSKYKWSDFADTGRAESG